MEPGRPTRTSVSSAIGSLLSLYPIGVVLLTLTTTVLAPRGGALALAAILLPHLCLIALALVPVALRLRHVVLRASLVLLALVTALRFGPDWFSLPRDAGDREVLTVATWNPLAGGTEPDRVVEEILATGAEIVAIQELTPDVADALDSDERIAARFPYRLLSPGLTVLGMGLLSAYPMLEQELIADPPGMQVRLDLGSAGSLAVVNGHPLPGSIRGIGGVPAAFDGTERDAATALLRERIDAVLATNQSMLVLGDYNVTPTEAGYGRLADGLRDAHAEAGNGTGWTWRPQRLAGLGIGLLRIDYVLTSPSLEPVGAELRCGVPGDHCILIATIAVSS